MDAEKARLTEHKSRGSRWPWIAAGLSAIYLAVLIALIPQLQTCPEPAGNLLQLYLQCRALNEFGDFLAGAFAPIAFLWLVTAVIVQSQELAEQRRELALTRQEFVESRAVAKAQAEEARRQAEFIGAQTEMLRDETQSRHHDENSILLDRQIDSLIRAMQKMNAVVQFRKGGEVQSFTFSVYTPSKSELAPTVTRLRTQASDLRDSIICMDNWCFDILELQHRLKEIETTAQGLNAADFIEYRDLNIEDFLRLIERLQARSNEHRRWTPEEIDSALRKRKEIGKGA